MEKKLRIFMMLVLLITQNGWSQSLQNWTVSKESNDTIVKYNFKKEQLLDLRLYVTDLEYKSDLYSLEKQKSNLKDSLLINYKLQIGNCNNIIEKKDTIIKFQSSELFKSDKWGKSQEKLKIKYKKQADKIPYSIGAGTLIGIILSLILFK
jgi:hypothetical protein